VADETPAVSQILSATPALTLLNSDISTPRKLRDLETFKICINMPNSTPYGCGWISSASLGRSWVTLSKIRGSSLGGV